MKYRPVVKYNFDNKADKRQLIKVSNELLDAAYEPTAADIEEMQRGIDPDPEDKLARHLGRQLQRGRIIAALDVGDRALAVKLAGDDRELLRLAASFVRRQGEQKRRPRDYPADWFNDLWSEINLLRRLWKLNQIKVARLRDAAIDIVVLRVGQFGPQTPIPDYLVEQGARGRKQLSLRDQLLTFE